MTRLRSPLRIVYKLVFAAVIVGVVYFVQGPMQAAKVQYAKQYASIESKSMANRQKATEALDTFQKVESPQDGDWTAFAESSESVSKEYDSLLAQVSTLNVPKEYRKNHDLMVRTLRIDSQTYANLAKAARDHDRNRMRDVVVDGNKLTQDLSSSGQ